MLHVVGGLATALRVIAAQSRQLLVAWARARCFGVLVALIRDDVLNAFFREELLEGPLEFGASVGVQLQRDACRPDNVLEAFRAVAGSLMFRAATQIFREKMSCTISAY